MNAPRLSRLPVVVCIEFTSATFLEILWRAYEFLLKSAAKITQVLIHRLADFGT